MPLADLIIALCVLAASAGWYRICSKRTGASFGARILRTRDNTADGAGTPGPRYLQHGR
jgi:hypothetical protein